MEDIIKKECPENRLDTLSGEIVDKIVSEENPEELKRLISLFNLNQNKKDIVRNATFGTLMDKISSQMLERIEKNPNAFSNKDLIDYLNAVKGARSSKTEEDIDTPAIQNNTQINVAVVDGMNRDSKEKVVDAVRSILNRLGSQADFTEIGEDNSSGN